MIDTYDYDYDDEQYASDEYDKWLEGELCGLTDGLVGQVYHCLEAGTEMCQFECPFSSLIGKMVDADDDIS